MSKPWECSCIQGIQGGAGTGHSPKVRSVPHTLGYQPSRPISGRAPTCAICLSLVALWQATLHCYWGTAWHSPTHQDTGHHRDTTGIHCGAHSPIPLRGADGLLAARLRKEKGPLHTDSGSWHPSWSSLPLWLLRRRHRCLQRAMPRNPFTPAIEEGYSFLKCLHKLQMDAHSKATSVPMRPYRKQP